MTDDELHDVIPLTDDERGALVGQSYRTAHDYDVASPATAMVADTLAKLAAATPNRIERLMVLGELARQTRAARDDLIDEALAGYAGAWPTWLADSLAGAAGISTSTVNRRLDDIARRLHPTNERTQP